VSQLTQQATVDHLVSSNPTVRAIDTAGHPVAGLIVVFNNALAASSATVTTGLDGTATTPWKLTQVAGQQTMVAQLYSAKHVLLGREVTFSATAVPDTLASIQPGSALNQPGLASQPVPTPPIVFAVDEFSNPKAGVGVTFEVASGSGSIAPAKVVTDANGLAHTTTWVLGDSLGIDTVIAHVPGLPPVYFTARAGPPFVATSVAIAAHLRDRRRRRCLLLGAQRSGPSEPARCVDLLDSPPARAAWGGGEGGQHCERLLPYVRDL
jgi:hypothetical protein